MNEQNFVIWIFVGHDVARLLYLLFICWYELSLNAPMKVTPVQPITSSLCIMFHHCKNLDCAKLFHLWLNIFTFNKENKTFILKSKLSGWQRSRMLLYLPFAPYIQSQDPSASCNSLSNCVQHNEKLSSCWIASV